MGYFFTQAKYVVAWGLTFSVVIILFFPFYSFSSYEPELFPGLIYRMVKPRIVLLIFVSGKVVLTGESELVL